jgi:DNA-binding MarR family transcriptional regulator
MSQSDLSRELIMHRSNVTGLVDRLERRRLVQRHDDPDDRRVYRVQLTLAGQDLVREILPHYYEAAEEVWQDIPVDKATHLAQLLRRLAENIESVAAARRSSPTLAAHET